MGDIRSVPVARRHLELLAGGLGVSCSKAACNKTRIFSRAIRARLVRGPVPDADAMAASAAARLALHHPFDAEIMARQWRDENCSTLILPAPVALRADQMGLLSPQAPTTIVAALARAGAARGQCRLAGAGDRTGRRFDFRRSRPGRRASRCRRPAGHAAIRSRHGAVRRRRRDDGRRVWRDGDQHARACADRWCRVTLFRPASSNPISRISRSAATASSIPAIPAGSTPRTTP